ncbi:hypothetical protein GMES_0763 [Paraglaciecola mesophila KMM 241]|uniref:Uncharacterized protein n=1 Tax=Paraglaciecola mesophila KMM 241 TaxID=1128912 RepID=K6Z251_9ALTE|nr:hypothetical protein GMES_0763 [Paraglaciecola mesophila KMM 241]
MPFLQALMTNFGLDTKNIGAQIIGKLSLFLNKAGIAMLLILC